MLPGPLGVPLGHPGLRCGGGVGRLHAREVDDARRLIRGVHFASDALDAIDRARKVIDDLAASPTPAYGVSTGFGALATRHIAPELRTQLQRSLVRSHAAGSGPEVEREVVRALMLLRLSGFDLPMSALPGSATCCGKS